jgi:hypothetical protein
MNPVADMFRRAAAIVLQDDRRVGNVVTLPEPVEAVVSGDLHGNRVALDKIIRFAALGRSPQTVLILQELIHGPADERSGKDRSIELLVRAARLFVEDPRHVLFLLGNHDVAQFTGAEITKNGAGVCKGFVEGVRYCFGESADEVLAAAGEFLLALPLAVRCPQGLWLSHSLPAPARTNPQVMEVLHRPYEPADLRRGGGAYEWTWGRAQTPEQIDQLAAELGVEFFLLGHRHSQDGFEIVSPRCVTITSDGAAGCVVRLPCDRPLSSGSLTQYLKPLVAVR